MGEGRGWRYCVSDARHDKDSGSRDSQVVIHHIAHTVDELTRERQALWRGQRRQSNEEAWWPRWGWIDVHRLVLGALKTGSRGLGRWLRHGGHVCVAFLDEVRHQEGYEGADCRGCDINYSPET